MTTRDMMDFLVEQRNPSCPPKFLAEIFEELIWITKDNGGEICVVLRDWIRESDPFREEIALEIEEVFLFKTGAEMESVYTALGDRRPDLREKCEQVLETWRRQPRNS